MRMEIKTSRAISEEVLHPKDYDIFKKWVAVEDVRELLNQLRATNCMLYNDEMGCKDSVGCCDVCSIIESIEDLNPTNLRK